MESMRQQFGLHLPDPESSGKQSMSVDRVSARITEFIYAPDSGVTFDAWFKLCEDIFRVEFAKADDTWKSPRDAEIRTRLLSKIEQGPDSTPDCRMLAAKDSLA
ncbi:unnamed protein product [Schistocephalus solidus]|uniref:Uncharacterized protein n=1 Tax=Schistocephalus solidus TaxID=70667 RepID=A0A183S8D5_SCHSO|nr:unnamed protein product [Schistocephalus solidus]